MPSTWAALMAVSWLEVLVALGIFLLDRDFTADGREGFLEVLGKADAVRRGDGGEERDLFQVEAALGELRHGGALERIDEAHAEDVAANLRHARIRRRRRDHGDLEILGDGRGLEGAAGGDLAKEGDDLVAGDELLDDGGGLALLRLVVFGDQLELPAEHAARGVELLDGEEGALVRGLAEGGLLAGER